MRPFDIIWSENILNNLPLWAKLVKLHDMTAYFSHNRYLQSHYQKRNFLDGLNCVGSDDPAQHSHFSLVSFVSASLWRNPRLTGTNLHLLQAPGNQPVQAGWTQATAETSEEGEEEGDGAEPVGRRRQTAGQHHPGLRHPGPKAAEQVSAAEAGWESLTEDNTDADPPLTFVSSVFHFSKPGLSSQSALQSSDWIFNQVQDTYRRKWLNILDPKCQILKVFLCLLNSGPAAN